MSGKSGVLAGSVADSVFCELIICILTAVAGHSSSVRPSRPHATAGKIEGISGIAWSRTWLRRINDPLDRSEPRVRSFKPDQ